MSAEFPWKQGFNTYGGAAGSSWTSRFVRERRLADYGVPEFHPQQWKRPDAARKALALHQQLGARFVSPYYLSVIADRNLKTGATLNRLEIRPEQHAGRLRSAVPRHPRNGGAMSGAGFDRPGASSDPLHWRP